MSALTSTHSSTGVDRPAAMGRAAARTAIVGYLCSYASEALRSTEHWAATQGMHTTDARAMAALGQAQRAGTAMTAGELGEAIGLSSPATSALIARLESAGHIERTRDPEDRRRVLLTPSQSAIIGAVAYFQPMGDAASAALDGFGEEDIDVIADFLGRLVRHMRAIPPS